MIKLGKYNELTILRKTTVGLYLGDDSGDDVLLPNKYCPKSSMIGDKITVFVYLDSEERKIATNLTPKILLNEFALLQVSAVSAVGAFLDWGLEKDLMVPFKEQRQKLEEKRWYIVYLDLDEKTDRLYASNKIEKFLQNEVLTVKEGDEVDLLILHETDLGFSVVVNNAHKGLIYENEIFKKLNIGDKLRGFVKKIRDDNKIDISIQPIGYKKFNDANSELIYRTLVDNEGFLAVTDKSSPDEIYQQFGISKKAFKKSIGTLYKDRKITIEPDGIKLKTEAAKKDVKSPGAESHSVPEGIKLKTEVVKKEVKSIEPDEEKLKKETGKNDPKSQSVPDGIKLKKEVVKKTVRSHEPDEEKLEMETAKNKVKSHWDEVYSKNKETKKLGWYQEKSEPSMRLLNRCNLNKDASILIVGAGATTLLDDLLGQQYVNIIANDISAKALEKLKGSLGNSGSKVNWMEDDITRSTELRKLKPIDLWHDRAVLHFFNGKEQQDAYFDLLKKLVKPGGFVIIAVFNLKGATECSGLPIFRYNEKMLHDKLGKEFRLIEAFDYTYINPSGENKEYVYTLFKREN